MSEPLIVNHAEAWDLAHHKASESNLARSYIELRNAVRDFLSGHEGHAVERFMNIEATISDSISKQGSPSKEHEYWADGVIKGG